MMPSLNSAPFKTKNIKQFNPFGGKLAALFRSSLVIYPLAKTASPIYIEMTVGSPHPIVHPVAPHG